MTRAPLSKPHRIAVLAPEVTIESGADAVHAREAAALVWVLCLELCQRHPQLAVLDAEATPLVPQDGHYAPSGADRGAQPDDDVYGPTRRDELIWLSMSLAPGKAGAVRLHSLAADGTAQTFDTIGRAVGEQIQAVFASWATARQLAAMPKKLDANATADDILATVRVVAPLLAEQARTGGVRPAAPPAEVEPPEDDGATSLDLSASETAMAIDAGAIVEEIDLVDERTRKQVRNVANRLPPAWKVPALRLVELAMREDLGEQILALDPEHPQALFRVFERAGDAGVLRRVLASAPGWARPYLALPDRDAGQASLLERTAGASIAAVCRPATLDVIDLAARKLADAGRVDDGLRMLERLVAVRGHDPRAHLALLDLHARTGREGARLAQAFRSARLHGCPMESDYPWYPDQIHVDLRASSALLNVGRLDEAIALRANRLEGREAQWTHHARLLATWKKDPRFVAWSYAREGAFRGDDARAVEGFGRVEPADAVDLALFLDALVAVGREDEVLLAWSQFGPKGPVARMAAARALMAAGEWRRGLEEMWRVALTEPGRDEHGASARCGLYLSCAPADAIEGALAERLAIGAHMLAKRMARDVADFVPAAAKSGVVARALGKSTAIEFDASWLAGFPADTRSRKAIDALFAELGAPGAD
ncbi:MAG TPA: hypothetical protein VGM56_20125, partial [Byssovorax sp.]